LSDGRPTKETAVDHYVSERHFYEVLGGRWSPLDSAQQMPAAKVEATEIVEEREPYD